MLPFVLAGVLLATCGYSSSETFGPIAARGERVAFVRQLDRSWPFAGDRAVWLGRSLDDADSWHRLADAGGLEVVALRWLDDAHLRITTRDGVPDDAVTLLDGVTIEWTQ